MAPDRRGASEEGPQAQRPSAAGLVHAILTLSLQHQRLDPLEEHIPAQKKCCDVDDLGEEFVAHSSIDPYTG